MVDVQLFQKRGVDDQAPIFEKVGRGVVVNGVGIDGGNVVRAERKTLSVQKQGGVSAQI